MKYNLSEITQLIKDRRTIYPEQYTDRKVLKDQVEAILNNAIWAPTHDNTQPWRFQIFMSEEGRKALSDKQVEIYFDNTPEEQRNEMKIAKLTNRPLNSSVVI